MMNTPQDLPLSKNPTLHWILCSGKWEELMIVAVLEIDTILIGNNYLDVSTLHIKISYFDGPHNQCRKSQKKSKKVKKS